MAVPKRKTSKSKRNMRRAHDGVTPVNAQSCTNCGEPVRSHHACVHCGTYKDRQI
ncbi:MAG: 50S ribosomal protein L32 [Mariprofundaceae bacterium]|nr:50S ribosomal protein L32 [Mariprofundaceae bacterium]